MHTMLTDDAAQVEKMHVCLDKCCSPTQSALLTVYATWCCIDDTVFQLTCFLVDVEHHCSIQQLS